MEKELDYRIERLRKLENFLIPMARQDCIEHRNKPEYEHYKLKLHHLELEAQERIFTHLKGTRESSRGVL